jgi:polysaccharide deacetylase family sporulation protein PdaB
MLVLTRKKLLASLLVVVLLLGAYLVTKQMAPGFPEKAISALVNLNRRLPIYCVQTSEKKIAISFDAAWGADRTDELLSILDEYGIKTTFFLVRFWVEKYPEEVRHIAEAGHEIGNHSATHPHMANLSPEQISFELQSTHDLIKEISGQEASLFRPPFGEYSNSVIETAEQLGYQTIQWSVDSLDWKPLSTAEIVQRVTSRIEPGSIVLFHNNGERTPDALRPILDFCKENGYQVVPISELLIKGDYYINQNNGMMCPK